MKTRLSLASLIALFCAVSLAAQEQHGYTLVLGLSNRGEGKASYIQWSDNHDCAQFVRMCRSRNDDAPPCRYYGQLVPDQDPFCQRIFDVMETASYIIFLLDRENGSLGLAHADDTCRPAYWNPRPGTYTNFELYVLGNYPELRPKTVWLLDDVCVSDPFSQN